MILLPALMSALTLLGSPALAEETTSRVPAAKKATAAAPAKAEMLDQVSVRLRCTAQPSGRVSNCVVLSESRPGYGFGEAAVALMDGAETAPFQQGGRPIERTFEHTIEFMP